MTEKKFKIILEILIIIGAMSWYIVTIAIPDVKSKIGSSDKFINISEYSNMIEFNINNTVNFAIIINKDKKISNILFFENQSLCLYNKEIEDTNIDKGINEIVKILIENDYLKQTSTITLTKYKDNNYLQVKNNLKEKLNYFNIPIVINENKNTLKNKAKELEIDNQSSDEKYIRQLDLYSKEIIQQKDSSDNEIPPELTESLAKEYADNVYKELEKYINTNNITNQDRLSSDIPIHLIPAEKSGKYYPNINSWYYVENSSIYAYIEFNNNFSYCYKGAIDKYTKGEC